MRCIRVGTCFGLGIAASIALFPALASAQSDKPIDADKARVIDHWNYERRSKAVPRDLVIDPRGLGYLRQTDGSLQPYGHGIPARVTPGNHSISPFGTAPDRPPSAESVGSSSLKTASRHTMPRTDDLFAMDGNSGGEVRAAQWARGGSVQNATGRLFFEMPTDRERTEWKGYVCSGTVANAAPKSFDGTERSVIITAAHCIYDDVNKVFARNVMFIPAQARGMGFGTDFNCSTDPTGCWVPSFGVVDRKWTIREFPHNVGWDYGFYVIPDSGGHAGGDSDGILDRAVGSLPVRFRSLTHGDMRNVPVEGEIIHVLGHSNTEKPRSMYCAEAMMPKGATNWWLPNCEFASGASGGPWVRPTTSGIGSIVSVTSWGYASISGMAGPRLDATSAYCAFKLAKNQPAPAIRDEGEAGVAVRCD